MSDEKQTLEERAHNRTQRPQSDQFRSFIGEDWGTRPAGPQRGEVADYLPARHLTLGSQFVGERLVSLQVIFRFVLTIRIIVSARILRSHI